VTGPLLKVVSLSFAEIEPLFSEFISHPLLEKSF